MQASKDPRDPLSALAAGDPAPFEAFVIQQTSLFVAFFRRQGARPADAEDLTQDVMMRLIRHAPSYEGMGRLEGYAFRVARNVWIDHCRRGRLRSASDEVEGDGGPTSRELSPDQAISGQEQHDRLFALVAGLGDTQREAFRLGVIEGMPYAEIAVRLGIPVGTVKSRVHHAVRDLRAKLSAEVLEQGLGGGMLS